MAQYGIPIPIQGDPSHAIVYDQPTFGPTTSFTLATITNVTNTSPIVITTSVPLTTRIVQISGVLGTTSANGNVDATPIGNNQYQLYVGNPSGSGEIAVAGNGAYLGGGIVSIPVIVAGGGSAHLVSYP